MYIHARLYCFIIIIISHLCRLVVLKLGCAEDKTHACCWWMREYYPIISKTLVCRKEPNLGDRSCDAEEKRRCCPMDEVCLDLFHPFVKISYHPFVKISYHPFVKIS